MRTVCGILLAAGQGARYRRLCPGQDKLLARCEGRTGTRTVVEHSLLNLRASVDSVLVVTRPDNRGVIEIAEAHGCPLLTLESDGMGTSIARAVASAADNAGWMIALADMPFISPATVRKIAGRLTPTAIVVPTLAGRYGHPVAFGQAYFSALSRLEGDQGGKRLFKEGQVLEVAVDDLGILQDIDQPQDLALHTSARVLTQKY